MDFVKLFEQFASIKVAVVGDVMLDTYWWGQVERISPEAPVPVVTVAKKEQRIGGAGNVALNVKALGAQVAVISILGNDDDGHQLIKLLQESQIQTNYLVQSAERITTNKIRIISRNQQMMRLDAEMAEDLLPTEEALLLAAFEKYIVAEKPQMVVLEDYNKGVLTENVIRKIIALCKQHQILTAVDPKRKNFFAYQGIDIFKPNWKEVKEGLHILSATVSLEELKKIHQLLQAKLQHAISFITLSEKGVYYENQSGEGLLPTHIRTVADVSGAGDTVIAVASLVYAATGDVKLMAELANIAGGLVCESVGTVAINKSALLSEAQDLLH